MVLALLVCLALWAGNGPVTAGRAPAGPGCRDCHTPHPRGTGTCPDCHGGDPSARRASLAHFGLRRGAAAAWRDAGPVLVQGSVLRDHLGCRRCHRTGGEGGVRAADLDAVVWRRDQAALQHALQRPADAMPRFGLTTSQADTLIARLLHDGDRSPQHDRYQVLFAGTTDDTTGVFSRRCGGCHRALGPHGPLGQGRVGPDLTGLLGPSYPVAQERRWDPDRLRRWLANPRSLDSTAVMPPQPVPAADLTDLVADLSPRAPGR